MDMTPPELQLFLKEHPACTHVFQDRLTVAGVDSSVIQVFVTEYGVLRREARVLDAHCSGSHARYREFQLSCGIRGQCSLDQALPGTRMALDGIQSLSKDLKRREGASWAIENVARGWAAQWRKARPEPNRCIWDGYWREILLGDNLIADPDPDVDGVESWQEGFLQALDHLSGFLDGCEAAVNALRVA